MTTIGELKKETSFVGCWVIQKALGAYHAVGGTMTPVQHLRFGWMMSTVMAMNRALRSVVTEDGEITTARILMLWEWSANIPRKQNQVKCFFLHISSQ